MSAYVAPLAMECLIRGNRKLPGIRRGLTLVEVFVVIVIIIILLGLLMPGISHSSNDTRRRMVCLNNMRNLAKAVAQFELTTQVFPGYQSAFAANRSDPGDCKLGTWVVSLLPYLEQQTLSDSWNAPDSNAAWRNAAPRSVSSTSTETNVEAFFPSLSLTICPSDINDEKHGRNSYIANCGFWVLSAPMEVRTSSVFGYQNQAGDIIHSQKSANGLFVDWTSSGVQKISRGDIFDGNSHTLLFAENLQADSWRYMAPETPAGSTRTHVGMVWHYRLDDPAKTPESRPRADLVQPINKINGDRLQAIVGDPQAARPSSLHSGSATVGMVDGSTRPIDEEIDYVIYQALLTPQTSRADVPDNVNLMLERKLMD